MPVDFVKLFHRQLFLLTLPLLGFAGNDLLHNRIDATQIREGTHGYQMLLRGQPVGTAHFRTSIEGDELLLQETTVIAPYKVEAVTEVRLDRKSYRTKAYRASGTMFGNPINIHLSWEADRVRGESLFPRAADQPQGNMTIDRTLPADCFERTSVFFLCHAMPLEDGSTYSFPWFNSYNDELKTVEVVVLGKEEVVTPAGTFRTWKLALNGGNPSQVVYITEDSPRKIAKIEVVGQPWVYELLPAPKADIMATTIFLLRHAEKGKDDPEDPSLNEAGHARAQQLAKLLGSAKLKGIHTTPYRRTRQTVIPLAEKMKITVQTYQPTDLATLTTRLRSSPGKHVVVGHSNTTPAIIRMFGMDPGPPFDEENEFDRLYILTLLPNGETTMTMLHY